ncbi:MULTISPECIES: hypothetical protein [Pandoraea]|uniref:hypothetical protein n=1 Tax=Pandoraea TaxID=93217 RepID=UPI001F5CE797|nr:MULTISPECIES: hypothetical protein [Pandoraea]MCI3208256.1 hypothetical protein [Pandoraea sp. LA3]MDN4586285.1 hypothetical protein [Pandoraea capi]
MCEVCAVFGVSEHWTDAGDPMGQHSVAAGILENRAERARRLRLINRILRPYGLKAEDWDGESYAVEDASGRRQLASDLSTLWRVAEQLGDTFIDPLEGEFVIAPSSWSDSYRVSN